MKHNLKSLIGANLALAVIGGCTASHEISLDDDPSTEIARAPELADALPGGHLTPSEIPSDPPEAMELVVYRGEPRMAARYGEKLLIEGDIEVGPADIEEPLTTPSGSHDKSVHTSGTNGGGTSFQWPGGVVPYTFDANVSNVPPAGGGPSQQDAFLAAMQLWMDSTPGLHFVPRSTQSDYITLRIAAAAQTCGSSMVGRQGNQQFVNVGAGCVFGFSTHHEIGHALGLFHEQSRTDLAANITINWGNIQGCPSTATSRAQCGNAACTADPLDCGCTAAQITGNTCDFSSNFGAFSASADVNGYDFDSVMHYAATAFGKCRNAANAIVLCSSPGAIGQTTLTPPAGIAIGQRTHLSDGDRAAMRVMYPTASMKSILFANTGTQALCRLDGRESDIGTYFTLSGVTSTAGSNLVNTTGLATTDYTVTCSARSLFWRKGYRYPNSTTTTTLAELNSTPASLVESYNVASVLRVLNPGLIAVLF